MLRRILQTRIPLARVNQKTPVFLLNTNRHFAGRNSYEDDEYIRTGGDSAFNKKQREFRDEYDNQRDSGMDYTIRYTYTLHDYYRILGCSQNASLEQIKTAYRNLAFQFHPDSHKNQQVSGKKKEELAAKFQLLKEAYDTLSKSISKNTVETVSNEDILRNQEEMAFQAEMTPEEKAKNESLNQYIEQLMREKKQQEAAKKLEETKKREEMENLRRQKQEEERAQMGKYADVDMKKYEDQLRREKAAAFEAAKKK